MSDRDVMKQALDALNLPSMKTMQMLQQRDEAITALQEKLAEEALQRLTDVQQEIEAVLAQFEKEPYAEQSRRVWQETQGRMRICPVTGGVGIGTPPPQQQAEPKNEFNPDWDQMAILVEQSQEQAAKIDALEKQLAERSAEYLAAHITYDNGYEAGRQDEPVTCAWSFEDDDTGTYSSACGELWSFIDGGWQDNHVRFCHGCGGKVVEAKLKETP